MKHNMTQEEKEVLLQDMCSRLPYNFQILCGQNTYKCIGVLHQFNDEGDWEWCLDTDCTTPIPFHCCKPYLFPLTEEILDKATEESNKLYRELICIDSIYKENNDVKVLQLQAQLKSSVIKYFLIHHIDYNGLIEKGLAIDATGLKIY